MTQDSKIPSDAKVNNLGTKSTVSSETIFSSMDMSY